MSQERQSVTCVIPAHNEGDGILETIAEIDQACPDEFELTVFVSEDGSRDNTREQVLLAAKRATLSTIQLSEPSGRLGYSRAVQRGISECQSDVVWFMDSDGQYEPSEVRDLFAELVPGTVVVGYRNPRVDSFARKMYSKLFGLVYKFYGGPKLIDPSCPFVLAYREDIADIAERKFHLAYGFWWEFQTRINSMGLKIIEVPVTHRNRLSGDTQVYKLRKLPGIVSSHLLGLKKLQRELSGKR